MKCLIVPIIGFLLFAYIECRDEDQDCTVCNDVLNKVAKKAGGTTDQAKVERAILDVCKVMHDTCTGSGGCLNETKHQDRFCYLIGGKANTQTSIYKMQVAKPLAGSIPVAKVCERLNKADEQTCAIKYEKVKEPVDWVKVLERVEAKPNKMRVKELKQILLSLGGSHKGFTEKSEYINEIIGLITTKQEL